MKERKPLEIKIYKKGVERVTREREKRRRLKRKTLKSELLELNQKRRRDISI